MDKYLAVLQARMGSTRLPGKVMLDICGKPVVWHVAQRVGMSSKISRIVVATSVCPTNDLLCKYLQSAGIAYFRGSETDVLARFHNVSKRWPSHAIVRVTCDNPLVDPKILDETISFFEEMRPRYVKTQGFPLGIGTEVFTAELLREAYLAAQTAYEREHVTPYMYTAQPSRGYYKCRMDLSDIRMTMDTAQDYEFIRDVYAHFFRGAHDFFLADILDYLRSQKTQK